MVIENEEKSNKTKQTKPKKKQDLETQVKEQNVSSSSEAGRSSV